MNKSRPRFSGSQVNKIGMEAAIALASRLLSRENGERTMSAKDDVPEPVPSRDPWPQDITVRSDPLDLKNGVFSLAGPKRIADSLKRSAENSRWRNASALRSAMSILNFYIRAGKNIITDKRHCLDDAKAELRRLPGR